MSSDEFYKIVNDKLKSLNLEEIKKVLNNIIRKVPMNKYDEIVEIFNKRKYEINEDDINQKIKYYKKKFKEIDEFQVHFRATGYEDYGDYYNPWGGDWVWEYSDDDNIKTLIEDSLLLAIDLTNKKHYDKAKILFDLILYTNYQVLDEDGEDNFEISLRELENEKLITISIDKLCLYTIYTTYQLSSKENRAINIYRYFENNNFKNINIMEAFKLGTEMVDDIDEFINEWICLLLEKEGNEAYFLLKEALEYNNFNNYQKYIDGFAKYHPQIYLDIFEYLEKSNQIDEILNVGNKALMLVDCNLTIRSKIALYLAKYDNDNQEKYVLEGFKSDTNVPNLLRIINNDYYLKHKEDIDSRICINSNRVSYYICNELNKNEIDEEKYNYLKFFTGNFDEVFETCLKYKNTIGWSGSPITYYVYLWLLSFNKTKETKAYNTILFDTFDKLGFKENTMLLDDDYSLIFNKWIKNMEVINKDKYLDWLLNIISKRVNDIVSNNHRGSYYKAAILVVAFGEVLESNNIKTKEEFINEYHQKYVRHTAFRKELRNYL